MSGSRSICIPDDERDPFKWPDCGTSEWRHAHGRVMWKHSTASVDCRCCMRGAVDIKGNAWRIMIKNFLVDPPRCD
jgi:hypothetical protein